MQRFFAAVAVTAVLAAPSASANAQQPSRARGAAPTPPSPTDSTRTRADSAAGRGGPFAGLRFRSIGPAVTSGRVADIAVHPRDKKVWYVATASGGVWKT